MPVSLGAVMGGPEETIAGNVCRRLIQCFSAERSDDCRPFLNVVFHFPGSLIKPDYTGLRTAKFSKKELGFMIQAAVPREIAESTDESEIERFMLDCVDEAIEMSRPRWEKHAIAFPFDEASASVRTIRG